MKNSTPLSWFRSRVPQPVKLRLLHLLHLLLGDPRIVNSFSTDARVQDAVLENLDCRQKIVDRFHRFYYDAPDSWAQNVYLGQRVEQLPLDLWLYQELVFREKPAFVLQTGIRDGGSILFFAHLMDFIGAAPDAVVVGVDIELSPDAKKLNHPRIRLVEGDSTDSRTLEQIERHLNAPFGLVSLDSDHSRDHVLRELELYARFTAVGDHLVVEDTNINGHPVLSEFGPGPFEAVEIFLGRDIKAEGVRFARDDDLWRRNLFSHHQGGWLLRVA